MEQMTFHRSKLEPQRQKSSQAYVVEQDEAGNLVFGQQGRHSIVQRQCFSKHAAAVPLPHAYTLILFWTALHNSQPVCAPQSKQNSGTL